MVVDDGGKVECDVILGHADLARYFDNLDLDVDLDQALRERVDSDQTGVDSASESTESRDETDVSLADWFVWVGTDHAAWNGTEETDAGSQRVD